MSTRMRDRRCLPEAICTGLLAGVRKASALLDRQRIHIGAHQYGRAITVAKQPDNARATNTLRHVVSLLAQPRSGDAGRAMLLHRQFRIGMNVSINVRKLDEKIVGWSGQSVRDGTCV